MIFHAANDQGLHFVLARDAAEVGPEPSLKIRLDKRAAFPGGPHAMHQTTGEGVHRFWIRCVLVVVSQTRTSPAGRKKSCGRTRVFFRP